MARSRYLITEPDKPHFLTCTVVEWLPVFSRPDAVTILLDSWRYQREHAGLRLFGYVVMENHLHFIAQAERLDKCLAGFKSFTARRIIAQLEEQQAEHCWACCVLPNWRINQTENISYGRREPTPK